MRVLRSLCAILALFGSVIARAEAPRDPSVRSGRTLEAGQVMIAGAAGWPWLWLQVEHAPSDRVSVGVRGAVLYGSPIMALHAGVGGELSLPIRVHVHREGDLDVALMLTPAITFGEAALTGEQASRFSGDFGWSPRLEAGVRLGLRVQERLTFFAGASAHAGLLHTPDAGEPAPAGALFAALGLEGMISPDTMLFVEAEGGFGIAPRRGASVIFGEPVPPLVRVSLGVAYLF
jgi:hypothetical protein